MANPNQPIDEKQVFFGVIPTSLTTVFTVGAGTRLLLKTVDLANDTAGSLNLSVYIRPNGGSTDLALVPTIAVAAKNAYQWSGFQVLEAGDVIKILGSGAGAHVLISGAVATL